MMSGATRTGTRHARRRQPRPIRVHGARVNNLKDISIELPKRRLTVFTGVSGSGKSSLVFATIAAESQRMINETYSAFVQGFMPSLARPEVDLLDGLTTAIIVDQERMGANPRSTVGTATDANAMLRILFSRIGTPHIGPPTAFAFNVPTRVASGVMKTDRGNRQETSVVREAVYQGGMCARCEGMGAVNDFDLTAIYDESKSLSEGALLVPGYSMDGWYGRIFSGAGLPMDKPVGTFTAKQLQKLLYGQPEKIKVEGVNLTYEGVLTKIQKSMLSKDLDAMQPHVRRFVERAVTFTTCPDCNGTRLSQEALSSKIKGKNIADLCSMQISDLADWLRDLDEPSVAPLLRGLQHLLDSFAEIGLGYLSLDRPAGTLSGGEAQRTKMIRHLGSSLTDVTYVFDEPTIGLHPHDIDRMNALLLQLRDKGNTVLVVEHKPETIAIADHVVDLGPGAGTGGGEVVFEGTVEALRRSDTVTGHHLDDRVQLKESLREATGRDGGPWRLDAQPARRRRRHPARGALRRHRCRRVGQELAHPRVGGRARGGRRRRPGRDPRLAPQQPGDLHRPARADPQGVRQGQRRQAGALQLQLRGRLPGLQRRRRHLHRARSHGDRRVDVRGVRGPALPGRGARLRAGRAQHRRGARHAGDRGARTSSPRARPAPRPPTRSSTRLADVGLGYLTLGQPLTTLSGGERQRLKLAAQMAEKGEVYVLDEPTTGLHLADVEQPARPARPARRVRQVGLVIEHHQAVMAHADWIIDLGPGAGHDGGHVVFEGTPGRPRRRPPDPDRRAPRRLRRDLNAPPGSSRIPGAGAGPRSVDPAQPRAQAQCDEPCTTPTAASTAHTEPEPAGHVTHETHRQRADRGDAVGGEEGHAGQPAARLGRRGIPHEQHEAQRERRALAEPDDARPEPRGGQRREPDAEAAERPERGDRQQEPAQVGGAVAQHRTEQARTRSGCR